MRILESELEQKKRHFKINKEWFVTTLNSIGDAVITTDTEGYVTFMNPVAQNLTGWKQEDALAKPLKDVFNVINEETDKEVENPVSKVLREGTVVGLANHTLLISKDGMKIPIDNSGAPIKDENGNIIGVVLVFRNITERKLMEKVLKESKERFEDLYENAPDGYYSLDGNGIIIEANKTFVEMFGYKKEELKGRHTSILFSEETKDEFNQFFSHLKEEGLIDKEVRFVKKNGKEMYVRFRGTAKHDEDKSYLEFKCTVRDITERKETEEKLNVLYELGKKITSMISRDELLPWIGEQAAKLLNADTCNYRIREGDYLIRGGGSKEGMELMKKERLKIGESLSGWIAKEKKPLIIPDGYPDDPRLISEHRKKAAEYGFRSALGVPMCIDGRVVGVLVVVSRKKREFTQTDIELLSSFSDMAAIAFENTKLFRGLEKEISKHERTEKKLKKKAEQLKTLYEVGKKVTSIVSKEVLLPWIAEQAAKLLDADTCNYRIREGNYLIRGGGTKEGMEIMQNERLKIGESVSGWIAKEKKPLIIPDGYSDDSRLISEHRKKAAEYGFRSALGVPMFIEESVVGVLNIISKKRRDFTDADTELLSAFADMAAIALEKARLFESLKNDNNKRKQVEKKLQHSMEKLRKSMSGIIHTMAMTVEAKDPYTAGHQRRVANLARFIAKEMNLPKQQIDAIRLAGTIHDLGKISVPGEILSKPGRINETEFDLIKDHTQVGYDILKEIEFPWPIAKIVLQHHERMDGSGYPSGLSGEDITMEARIIAVADVVEAMAFHRPYRPALGIKKALDELSQNKDILYDSQVVDVCLKLFTEKGFKFE